MNINQFSQKPVAGRTYAKNEVPAFVITTQSTLLAVLTAVTVVLGMRMMGALLISSLIIFPAISAMRVCKSFRTVVICSAAISVSCFLIGISTSFFLETPTGASIVIADLLVFALFSLIGKGHIH